MKQNFAGRYAAMSDEQLEYEASQSDGFAIDAREAMRREFDKRGLAYSDQLSAKRDGVQSGGDQHAHPQQTLGQFFEKHPIISFFVFLIITRITYRLLAASFGG